MSTRGFVGFVVDGVEKLFTRHHDAYPGREVLLRARDVQQRAWIGAVSDEELVDMSTEDLDTLLEIGFGWDALSSRWTPCSANGGT